MDNWIGWASGSWLGWLFTPVVDVSPDLTFFKQVRQEQKEDLIIFVEKIGGYYG